MNNNSVGIVTGGRGGLYSLIGQQLSNLLDNRCGANPFRLVVMLGVGSRGNLDDIRNLRRTDIGLVQSDVLESLPPDERKRLYGDIRYIAPLHHEVIQILASGSINSFADLAGKRVNIDAPGSGTQVTARTLFRELNVTPQLDESPNGLAVRKLLAGDVDAVIFVAGHGVSLFREVQVKDVLSSGLHFVPLPHALDVLAKTYTPDVLSHDDYNDLIRPGETVETWAAQAVMAVYGWGPGAKDRYQPLQNFVNLFFAAIPRLGGPGYRGMWCEVDVASSVPGWRRFDVAEDWLKAHAGAPTKPCG
jgi:TRAP transporter TAXI family solute receptor